MSRYEVVNRLVILAIGLLCISVRMLTAGDLCAEGQTKASLPFQLHNGGIVIPVQVNDHLEEFNFVLDTGDEKTIIDKRITQTLRLPTGNEVTVLGPEAAVSATLVYVRKMRVGRLTIPVSMSKTRSRQTRDSTGELILPFGYLSQTRVTRPWPSVPKGRDWIGLVGPCYAAGVDGIRRKVRIFRPDCLLKRLVAGTGDEVHRLQKVQSRDQAREAEWGATQGHLY
jgi:hypothetical protein